MLLKTIYGFIKANSDFKIQIRISKYKSVFQNTHLFFKIWIRVYSIPHAFLFKRHDSDSDTADTDSDHGWGGKGIFEYTPKALPHALQHIIDILMRAGHHGGVCAFLAEVSHKRFIKMAATMSRTYGSRGRTEREMLKWTLTDAVYEAAIEISAASELTCTSTMSTGDEAHSDPDMHRTFRAALPPFMQADRSQFAQVQGNTLLRVTWERKMLSKRAKVTRKELLTFICEKLALENTRATRTALVCTLDYNTHL